ncbi:Bax inhibitor-1/YccA family protein [bacterium]|nr:Bax inhibitor-1/YccA family protein [bacterium]
MANPVLNQNFMQQERVLDSEPMTINGSINKTFVLLGCLLLGSLATWHMFYIGAVDKVMAMTSVAFFTSIIFALITIFNRKNAGIFAPVYSVSEGVLLGGISAVIEQSYPGIAIQAVGLTMLCLFSMLILYKTGLVKCTEKFRSVLFISTLSVVGIYLINFIGHFFHMQIPYIFTSSTIGIGFSLLVVAIASLNFIIDFDFIEKGSQYLLPKYMEWYGAFGLMVTLVWLYIEILNLLAKMRDR